MIQFNSVTAIVRFRYREGGVEAKTNVEFMNILSRIFVVENGGWKLGAGVGDR